MPSGRGTELSRDDRRPRRAGRSPRWYALWNQREVGERAGTRRLVNLPRGYHAPAGGQGWHDHVRTGDELPSGRRVIGPCQVDEMTLWPGRLVGANPEPSHPPAATTQSEANPQQSIDIDPASWPSGEL